MTRAICIKTWFAALCLSFGLAATGAPSQAQTSDNEQASTDTLICMAAYAAVLDGAPDDNGAKRGLVTTVDIYQALTGKTDDEVSSDAAAYATTLVQLDKDGVQALSDVRDHCDAVFMDL